MIEIIAVLVVIGILAAVAVSRIVSTQSFSVAAEVDILKTHLRYAQFKAMSEDSTILNCNAPFGVVISGSSYYLFRDCNTNQKVILPNEDVNTASLSFGINSTCNTFCFDTWGAPYCGAGCEAPGPLGTSSTINVTLVDTGFAITKNTGFMP